MESRSTPARATVTVPFAQHANWDCHHCYSKRALPNKPGSPLTFSRPSEQRSDTRFSNALADQRYCSLPLNMPFPTPCQTGTTFPQASFTLYLSFRHINRQPTTNKHQPQPTTYHPPAPTTHSQPQQQPTTQHQQPTTHRRLQPPTHNNNQPPTNNHNHRH